MQSLRSINKTLTLRSALVIAAAVSIIAGTGCGSGSSEGDCSPANCPGCCLMGQCVFPQRQSSAGCGIGGQICQVCQPGYECDRLNGTGCRQIGLNEICDPACDQRTQDCVNGACVTRQHQPCGADCAGCCDPHTGICIDILNQNQQMCGVANQDCKSCGDSETCQTGVCQPGGTGPSLANCDPQLECYSTVTQKCEINGRNDSCGRGVCKQCTGNQRCINGECQISTSNCLATCQGCCVGEQCYPAGALSQQDDSRCGNGIACRSCLQVGSDFTCNKEQGMCVSKFSPDARRYKICVQSAMANVSQHPRLDGNDSTDPPELFVDVSLGTYRASTHSTEAQKLQFDSGTYWKSIIGSDCVLTDLPETVLRGATLKLVVRDRDIVISEEVYQCSVSIPLAALLEPVWQPINLSAYLGCNTEAPGGDGLVPIQFSLISDRPYTN